MSSILKALRFSSLVSKSKTYNFQSLLVIKNDPLATTSYTAPLRGSKLAISTLLVLASHTTTQRFRILLVSIFHAMFTRYTHESAASINNLN